MSKGLYLLAPERAELRGPAVFLAGPIQGAPDWQSQAARLIQELDPELHVCSPRRGEVGGDFDDEKHGVQVDWETEHLRRCAENGVILFWLPAQAYDVPGRQYAQTTRFELGNWEECARRREIKLVVGFGEGFSNARYLRRRLRQDCPQATVTRSLEELCVAAVEAARADALARPPLAVSDVMRVLAAVESVGEFSGYFEANRASALALLRERGVLAAD
jgi:hypothetical protein